MGRKKQLNRAFQRGHLLNLKNPLYKNWVKKFIVDETNGDIGSVGDITSGSILKNKQIRAIIYSRSTGIVSGIEEVSFLLKTNNIAVKRLKKDGDKIKKGTKLLEIKGKENTILRLERSALDLLSRMSGISTLTNELIKKIRNRVKIAPTRKTQWRYLDKKAVYAGEGMTHRLALWESILIKDNHLAALKREKSDNIIESALERASKNKKANFIEIEVTDEKQAMAAAKKFKELKIKKPCLVMLDNMKPKEIKDTIKSLKAKGLYRYVLVEASGGIDPNNIVAYSRSGADVLSMGYLTTASHSLDIKLKVV